MSNHNDMMIVSADNDELPMDDAEIFCNSARHLTHWVRVNLRGDGGLKIGKVTLNVLDDVVIG